MQTIRYLLKAIIILMMIQFFSGSAMGRDIGSAVKLYETEQYNEAYIEYENVYIEDSNDLAALCGMAWCKFKTGRLEKAQAMFKSILRKQPYHPGATQGLFEVNEKIYGAFNVALALHYAKDYDGAIAAFQSILDDGSRLMPEKELWRVFLSMGQTCYKKMILSWQTCILKTPWIFSITRMPITG